MRATLLRGRHVHEDEVLADFKVGGERGEVLEEDHKDPGEE